MSKKVYILGGYQTDFSINYKKEGKDIYALLKESVEGAFEQTNIAPKEVESAHIGNFVGELFCGQGQLGGMFVSIEMMRNVGGKEAAEHLGAAAWIGKEAQDAQFPWPYLFNEIGEMYEERYGLQQVHLAEIAKTNYENAKRNPKSQTRDWGLDELFFTEDNQINPIIEGSLRKSDCGRITDGSATVFLASEKIKWMLEKIPLIHSHI